MNQISTEDLYKKIESLEQEIKLLLKTTNVSKEEVPFSLNRILEQWKGISENQKDQNVISRSLQKVLNISVDLVEANEGTLFLFDDNQSICEYILTDKITLQKEKKDFLNKILHQGLAGWVIRNKEIGLVNDTQNDERWLKWENDTSSVRSALSIPIYRGETLLSIITLHHDQINYFHPQKVNVLKNSSNMIALLIEIAFLQTEKAHWEVQRKLLENLVEVAKSPVEGGFVKAILQKTLDLASDLTNATKGSMFLLHTNTGAVVDAILSRRELPENVRKKLLGSVLDKGLAGWVIKNKQIGLIEDIETDGRWVKLPNDTSKTRSALAIPIMRFNEVLGLITLEHDEPKHFTHEMAHSMESTASQMALVLENLKLYHQVESYANTLNQELQKGREMQKDFLPYEVIQPSGWEISTFLTPAKDLAGDFYDVFQLGDYVGLVIADVCDKGVGSAMFMGLMRSLIRIFSGQTQLKGFSISGGENQGSDVIAIGDKQIDLAQISGLEAVKLTNQYVAENHWMTSMFATMFFGILNPKNGVLTYISGGHEPLFIINEGNIIKTLDSTGPAVGMMPNMQFIIEQVQMEKGDILFAYTDGVTEGKNIKGELFTPSRLMPLLQKPVESASALLERVKTNLVEYIGEAPQFDDITILSVKRLED